MGREESPDARRVSEAEAGQSGRMVEAACVWEPAGHPCEPAQDTLEGSQKASSFAACSDGAGHTAGTAEGLTQ